MGSLRHKDKVCRVGGFDGVKVELVQIRQSHLLLSICVAGDHCWMWLGDTLLLCAQLARAREFQL